MSDDLVAFLRDQLDEDERIARAANTSPEMVTGIPRSYAEAPVVLHIARFADPARVLREIDAKRRLLYQFEQRGNSVRATAGLWDGGVWDDMLRLLALPYADRPGYRKEWRP